MNVLAQLMMKNAAKSDLHCELQKSVNQQIFQHCLYLGDKLEGVFGSMSMHFQLMLW